MKKTVPFILSALLLLCLFGCKGKEPVGGTDSAAPTDAQTTAGTSESVSGPDQTSSESAPAGSDAAAAAAAELAPGCYYGARSSDAQTRTGLTPLPTSDFPDARFPEEETFSTKTREHAYGVAQNERPHEISVNNQKFFDDGGYDALCLDTKHTDKRLYLTFDCGYENGYTAKILDTLRDKDVHAAFFCTLPQMEENPDLIARMINEGHIVGNHSVTHPNFADLSRRKMYDEVKGFDDHLRENFGYSAMYFRYPQGKYSEASLDLLNSMGYRCVFWSLAYADWDLEQQAGAQAALETVVSRLHPGAVILLHAVSPDNANALADIIDTARAMGYTFRTLSDY